MMISDELIQDAERLVYYLKCLRKGGPVEFPGAGPGTSLPPHLALSRAQSLSFGLNSQIQRIEP